MMKRVLGGVLLAALIATPATTEAQTTIGPTVAYDADAKFGIGATLGTALTSAGEGFGVLADFLLFFPDGPINYMEINANVTYDFPLENSTIVPFLLGGLNIARVSSDVVSVSSTELGLNLGGGIDFDAGNFRPTAGVRAEVNGGEALVFFITLPFQTGN